MTTEEWRDVIGFVGHYQVSNHGRVRSLARTVPVHGTQQHRRVTARILRRNGRQQFCLGLRGTGHMRSIEQLMQEAGFPVTRGRK